MWSLNRCIIFSKSGLGGREPPQELCASAKLVNLSYDGGYIDLSYDGGGGLKVPPPLFLFVKTIEKVIRLCTVLKFFFFDWQF